MLQASVVQPTGRSEEVQSAAEARKLSKIYKGMESEFKSPPGTRIMNEIYSSMRQIYSRGRCMFHSLQFGKKQLKPNRVGTLVTLP
jgi:hypothetical protein